MQPRVWRHIATWVGVAALLCQILLPFGLARLENSGVPGELAQAAQDQHYHDPGLANSLGRDWILGHSHAGDTPSGRVRFDLAYLTPFAVVDPPEAPAVFVHWAAFIADRMAPAPSASDGFTRPLPRAPPLSA
ncbi:MAG: hypothetical protein WA459_12145 [Stellaceae bacterium]